MSETAPTNVIPFAAARTQRSSHTGERAISGTAPSISREHAIAGATALAHAPAMDIDRLYEPDTSSLLVVALEMLGNAASLLENARRADDQIAADRFIQRLQMLLPKLFDCRAIGDGFGVIISSLQFALDQLDGQLVTASQITVIWRVIKELRTHPAMSLEEGVQRVSELEESGLAIDPPNLEEILDSFPA